MTVCVVEQERDLAVVPNRTICIDEVVAFLSANHYGDRNQLLPVHWTAHSLKPVSSHEWHLDENYERVSNWKQAALAAIASATQDHPPSSLKKKRIVEFLAEAMLDRYGHDRASYVSAHLSDHPPLEAGGETYYREVHHDGRVSWLEPHELEYSSLTPKVADRVAEVTKLAVPDDLLQLICRDTTIPYVPVLYAKYGDWCVKVAEYK